MNASRIPNLENFALIGNRTEPIPIRFTKKATREGGFAEFRWLWNRFSIVAKLK